MTIKPHRDSPPHVTTPSPGTADPPPRDELTHYLLRLVADRHVKRRAVVAKAGTPKQHTTAWHVTAEQRPFPTAAVWALELLGRWELVGWTPYQVDRTVEFAWPTLHGLDVLAVWDGELLAGVEYGLVERTGGQS